MFTEVIPLYAILSHTWEEEEVCFHHLNDPNIDHISMKGWYKIEKSCLQAVRDGLKYIWVDTVCIDKSSSTELSEAINSMFRWYRNATVCYAYLSDLPEVELKDCRWLTRGWTLQEMIAPKEVKFYDKDWNFKGAKSELFQELCEITGVDKSILLGGELRLISVARRISWASNRRTARVEDMAYCLLGLFDISMPMLYGEGHKAFLRLQEEIVKEYDDHSLFAWKGTSSADSTGLFAKSPADFACSANMVPCLGRRSEPAMVTSRGVRISISLTKIQDQSPKDPLIVGVLNCRSLDFDMESTKRIAIALRRCYDNEDSGTISGYVRIRPKDLFWAYSVRAERHNLYILKQDHFQVADSRIFLVRTMPVWPEQAAFKLIYAYPEDQWDDRSSQFRVKRATRSAARFALVFCQASPNSGTERLGCFVVFLGAFEKYKPVESESSLPAMKGNTDLRCHIQFHQHCDIAQLNLEQAFEEKCSSYNASCSGAGMMLKCYASRVVVCGQEVYCADLHVKETDTHTLDHCQRKGLVTSGSLSV